MEWPRNDSRNKCQQCQRGLGAERPHDGLRMTWSPSPAGRPAGRGPRHQLVPYTLRLVWAPCGRPSHKESPVHSTHSCNCRDPYAGEQSRDVLPELLYNRWLPPKVKEPSRNAGLLEHRGPPMARRHARSATRLPCRPSQSVVDSRRGQWRSAGPPIHLG